MKSKFQGVWPWITELAGGPTADLKNRTREDSYFMGPKSAQEDQRSQNWALCLSLQFTELGRCVNRSINSDPSCHASYFSHWLTESVSKSALWSRAIMWAFPGPQNDSCLCLDVCYLPLPEAALWRWQDGDSACWISKEGLGQPKWSCRPAPWPLRPSLEIHYFPHFDFRALKPKGYLRFLGLDSGGHPKLYLSLESLLNIFSFLCLPWNSWK